jgi:hypothetical protein
MTLVLAALAAHNSVILAADSVIGNGIVATHLDRKLFPRPTCAAATFGSGFGIPAMVDSCLKSDATLDTACAVMEEIARKQANANQKADVHSLVVGLRDSAPEIWHVNRTGSTPLFFSDIGEAPRVHYNYGSGVKFVSLEKSVDHDEILTQMLGMMRQAAALSSDVGPPFPYVVLSADPALSASGQLGP